MCGRFTNEFTWAELHALYSLSDQLFPMGPPSNMQPRFNIAPTQDVDFVALTRGGNLELLRGRWWLVPHWAKELPKAAMFNARIETVDSTAAFRDAWRYRRCLIPADGYFEWTVSDEDGGKDPRLLQMPDGEGFSFAGLWAHNDNLGVTSCTIITAPAVPEIAHIHTRMPVILPTETYSAWLVTDLKGDDAKALLLGSQIDSLLTFHRVARDARATKAPTPRSL